MKRLLGAVLLLFFAVPAFAVDPFNQLPPGTKIVHKFNSIANGYRGVLAELKGAKRVFYVTPDNKYLIAGVIYDADGRNITTDDLKNAIEGRTMDPSKPQPGLMDTIFLAASKANGFVEGAGPDIYVYFDANCPYCHKLWLATRNHPNVKIHWLPVAGLRPDSLNKGAELVKNPSAKLMQQMADGKIAGLQTVSKDLAEKLEFNMGAMAMTGSTKFPTIVYTDGAQKKVAVGLPDEILTAKIFGPRK